MSLFVNFCYNSVINQIWIYMTIGFLIIIFNKLIIDLIIG